MLLQSCNHFILWNLEFSTSLVGTPVTNFNIKKTAGEPTVLVLHGLVIGADSTVAQPKRRVTEAFKSSLSEG